jgi:YfiH family protein
VLELGPPGRWAWIRQVHGAGVATFDRPTPGMVPEADAAVTAVPDLPVVVMTADCGSLALACDDAVAMVHVGWRGLLAGVVDAAVAALRANGRGRVRAALGPCIRAESYDFGSDDLATLVDVFGPEVAATTKGDAPALDLPAGIRIALERAGARLDHDVGHCTAAEPRYFSHRRDGVTGRQVGLAVLPGPGSPRAFRQDVA